MQQAGGQAPAPVADITEAEVAEVQQVAGGKDEYASLMTWAAESMPKEDVAAFDALVSTGNSRAIKLAVAGLKAQYETLMDTKEGCYPVRQPLQPVMYSVVKLKS